MTAAAEEDAPGNDDRAGRFRGVLQLQSRADASLVIDAADLWRAPDAVAAAVR
ncbi:MAG: hypothetical protein U5R31_05035 [Acidimicrobiia bacterium]|nr:hypothetical protein [Acidimicrobiia bacterium]